MALPDHRFTAADPALLNPSGIHSTGGIQARGLSKRYPGSAQEALAPLTLDIAPGEVYALLGPNGAGKTTTVELLTGLRVPTSGSVRVLGLDPCVRAERAELLTRVGVVLQETGYPRYLTVRETLGMFAAYFANPRPPESVLEMVGLEPSADMLVRQLSGGQHRRLDVGVALIGRPQLIFLDEPTTGFDPAARRRAWELVERLRDLGTGVLLTTHYMEEAQRLADRVGVLLGGHLVAEGTPAELAEHARLCSVVRFRLPAGADLLFPAAVSALLDEPGADGVWTAHTATPTALLHELCSWAGGNGVELEALSVTPPSLEESYLQLTRAPAGLAPADAQAPPSTPDAGVAQ